MIKLSKTELHDIAETFVLANTPRSLFHGLLGSNTMRRLRTEPSPGELLAYYNTITARAERDEIVISLAYAVLIALYLHQARANVTPDVSRLEWGEHIARLAKAHTPPPSIILDIPVVQPTPAASQKAGSGLIVIPTRHGE